MTDYYLVIDATARQVEHATGLRGLDAPLGVLVEKPRPFDLEAAMAEMNRALDPCICGRYAIVHRPQCPAVRWGIA